MTTASAWYLALDNMGHWDTVQESGARAAAIGWPTAVPQSWGTPDFHRESRLFGRTEIQAAAGATRFDREDPIRAATGGHDVFVARFGWPFHALESIRFSLREGFGQKAIPGFHFISWNAGVARVKPGGWGRPTFTYIPLRPALWGFLANTFLFASLLYLLTFAAKSIRSALRRRRNLCPRCAYDTRGLTTCPECGTSL